MAKFSMAVALTLRHEGGYINNPDDPGGETIFGISRKNNPKWVGWNMIEGRLKKSPIAKVEKDTEIKYQARILYRKKYWRNIYDKIGSQRIANQLFDIGVNMGVKRAVLMIQMTLPSYEGKADGIFGPLTLESVNNDEQQALNNDLVWERICNYWYIAENNPVMFKFIKGWIRRSLSYLHK